jgi:uncharacterized protein YggE
MKRTLLAFAAAAMMTGAAAVALAQVPTAPDDAMFRATTVSLAAYGETRISPDMATITFGVMTQAPTAAEAMQANRTRMNAVAQALRAQGIADRDIQTSGLNLSPQYSYEQNQPPKLIGYQASNDVTITARDLANLGKTVDAVVGAGVNQINGIAFGLQNPRTAEDQARQAAVQSLAAKAALYAQATGHKVVRLVNINEQGQVIPLQNRPVMMRMAADAAESRPTNIEPGELRVRIDVSGIYELGR